VLSEHEDIDKSKVHTQGGSYGGYMSAIFGCRHSEIFKSATILNGVLNLTANMWFTDIPEWNSA
jgi:dipeptidyl aminopeptidase/acylaminoacyl peptidase